MPANLPCQTIQVRLPYGTSHNQHSQERCLFVFAGFLSAGTTLWGHVGVMVIAMVVMQDPLP